MCSGAVRMFELASVTKTLKSTICLATGPLLNGRPLFVLTVFFFFSRVQLVVSTYYS